MLTITTNSFENDVLHADKPVLVDFWAQWCPYCRRIAPAFDKVGEQYADMFPAFPQNVQRSVQRQNPFCNQINSVDDSGRG